MLKCKPSWVVYENNGPTGNGYMVVSYKLLDGVPEAKEVKLVVGQNFTAVGYYLPTSKGSIAYLDGKWEDGKRGLQLKVETATEEVERSQNGIVEYLSSGMIPGIGKRTAEKIYKQFGNETIDIMDNDIERLSEIKGITQKKISRIKEGYKEAVGSRECIVFLANFGISPKKACSIANTLKVSVAEIKENPYLLIKSKGISFVKADEIAKALSYPMDSPNRIKAAIYHTLYMNEQNGNLGISKEKLGENVFKTLNTGGRFVSSEKITAAICERISNKAIVPVNGNLYRYTIYQHETDLAKSIISHKKNPAKPIKDLLQKLKKWEKTEGIMLDPIQEKAVITALSEGISIITGGPGCGKTTIAKAIVELRKTYGKKKTITLLAPTGRAATRLSELTGEIASTIHSAFQIHESDRYTEVIDDYICDSEQVIIDEASMCDLEVARIALMQIEKGCNITFIGDPDQLPSVGPGAVLRDMICSNIIPTVKLKKIYRQGEGSTIVKNALKINSGDLSLECNKSDFVFYNTNESRDAARKMISLYEAKVKEYGWENVVLLSPFHTAASETSTNSINKKLQALLNPAAQNKREVTVFKDNVFREGDIVMQLKNENNISNGDIGRIVSIGIDDGTPVVTVKYQNQSVEYSPDKFDVLELAYGISIHKSQGSEYKCVILCLLDEHRKMLKRNLFYTGVTRASKEVHLIASVNAVKTAIQTKDTEERITLLSRKLIQLNG